MLLGAGGAVVLAALLGIVAVVYLVKAIGNIDRYEGLDTDAVAIDEPRNYLVVGSDSRIAASEAEQTEVGGQRSDTIMVVRLNPDSERATVLALPRDLVVPIAGTGDEARINTAYNHGRQVLIDTIRDNFDIEINHYVEIDFEGFKRLVDAIGGVPLWLETAIKDTKSGLFVQDQGCVELDGDQALAYARSRQLQYMTPNGWSRPDPTADLGRIQRQQVFIRRALVKALDASKTNPLRLKDLIDIGTSSVGVDADTDPLALFNQFRDFEPNNLDTYALPVVPRSDNATVEVDEATAEPVLTMFRNGQEESSDDEVTVDEIDPADIRVTVLNGSQTSGQAHEATVGFEQAGFRPGVAGNATAHSRTTVYYNEDDEDLAQRVAQFVEGGAEVKENEDYDLSSDEVIVVTGSDFGGVSTQPAAAGSESGSGAPSGGAPAGGATTGPAPTAPSEYAVGEPPRGVDCG